MKNATVRKWLALSVLSIGTLFGFQLSTLAQQCWLNFPPGGSPATVSVYAPWANGNVIANTNASHDPSYFIDQVTTGNAEVPDGTYLAWCIDFEDSLDGGLASYPTTMFSSCDTNLDAELHALGLGYPGSVYISPQVWNEVNYILNHKNGAYFNDIQIAIWALIGGPGSLPLIYAGVPTPLNPPFDTNEVNALLNAATNNAATWQPECGDVIGVVVAILQGDYSPVQLTMIEVPYPCVPCINVTKQVACLQPTNSCGDFGKVASGYAGAGCSGINQPGFCYQISVTNCGTVPLTNIVVWDNLLGLLTTNFFTNNNQILAPGTGVTSVFSMSFATNATNTVTVSGDTDLPETVTNLENSMVITNGTPVSAFDSAVAVVDNASLSCSLSLFSPLDLDGNPNDNNVTLPAASFYSTTNSVTLSIQVCNTGQSVLTNISINMPALAGFNCSPPGSFTLAPGACQTFQLCVAMVTCPAQVSLDMTVTGQVAPDANHCAVYDMSSTNVISVCSSCSGTISCSTNTGCTSGTGNVSGTVLLHCNPANPGILGDSGLAGIPVTLLGLANNPLATNITDANGNYSFTGLAAGSYFILVTPPAGYVETLPLGNNTSEIPILIAVCTDLTNVAFGYANTQPPMITVVPGGPLGCNPATLPTDTSVATNVTVVVSCGTATTNISHMDTTNGCVLSRTFTIVVTDTYGNSATNATLTYTWTTDTAAPVLNGVPAGTNYGCNPASVATVASVQAVVTASDTCSPATVTVTEADVTNGCLLTQIFTIVATNACGNMATAYVTNSWTADITAPVLNGVPAGTNYGCNPTSVATLAAILSGVTASDTCSPATVSGTAALSTNGCQVTDVFTITAVDGCNNKATAFVTNTWTADTAAPVLNGVPAGTNYGCNPASVATLSAILSTVTASDTCSPATVSGSAAMSTNGCLVTEVFTITATNACGNKATANVTNTWTADTTAPILNGVPASKSFGCNPTNLPTVASILSGVTASDTCSATTLGASATLSTNSCLVTQVITISATNACGGIATASVTNTWTTDTAAPVLSGVPAGKNLGCNPTNIPTAASIQASVTASDTCSPATVKVTASVTTNSCAVTQVFSIVATNSCGNIATASVTNTWTTDTAAPVLSGVPAGKSLGCNPTNIPTVASLQATITASDSCSPATVKVTAAMSTNGCAVTQVFTVIATNACGNIATAYVTNMWTADSTPPVLSGVPAGKNLGCNPTNIPTVASIQGVVSASDTCSATGLKVTGTTTTNGCGVTQVFSIVATNACGGTATAYVTNTWANPPIMYVTNITYITNITKVTNVVITTNITITTNCCTNLLCGNFNSQNPNGGWLWCNSHISCYPGTNCTINCQGGSISLNCWSGKTYTYQVPNCQINFSSSCTTATNWYDNAGWHTTLPCAGDDEIFTQGCPIPWLPDFANCKSVCWTTGFNCSQSGLNCNWQWGAACYNDSQPTCNTIAPKACHSTPCQNGQYYTQSDHAGCPENHKPYCVGGGTGGGGNNCTGSWSGTDSICSFGTVTNKAYFTNYVVVTNIAITTNTTVTTDELGPVLSGVPVGMNFGCNPTNVPTVASVQAAISASQSCSAPTITVTGVNTTNACAVVQVFTISATDACNNSTTAHVTNTWTVSSGPTITCPPDVTLTNGSGGGGELTNYCTYTQGGWGADPHGCNAGSLLCNKFSSVYPCGYVQVGITNGTGKCLRFTSSSACDTFLPCGGTATCLTSSATNCSSCSAGVFGGEVLTLQLNCDFSKSGIAPCSQPFGNLVYNCSTSPFNGQTVNQILGICNTALGGGSISNYGCTINDLECIANQLNGCFDGGCGCGFHTNLSCGSSTNLVIPPPSQTGTPTVTDTCSSVTITNIDSIVAGTCKGNFVITRTWIAMDACGLSSTCVQTITINPCSSAPPLVEGCAAGSAQVGVPYSSSVVVSGGVAPYTFALVSGNLPNGLSLNTNTGVISGTPTTSGTNSYTLKVTDSLGNADIENSPCQLVVSTVTGCPITCGDTATIGFWNNKNGQGVINCFNGGPSSTNLGYTLATVFPYLYGSSSGTNNLANKSNAYIAGLFQTYFSVTGQKTDAEMLAVALACYATDSSFGGNCGAPFGFNISSLGTEIKTYNVKNNGSAIGLSNNTSYTVLALLEQANLEKQNGTYAADAGVFDTIFDGINSTGDIH